LFRKSTSVALERSLEEQIERQRMKESSRRLMLGSSDRRSLKQEIGARKIMALTLSKKGSQAARLEGA
jgi:hypothetical protein